MMWSYPNSGVSHIQMYFNTYSPRNCANENFFLKFSFPYCNAKIATDFLSVLILRGVLLNIFVFFFNHLHRMAQKHTPVNKMGLISLIDLVMSVGCYTG